MLLNVLKLTPSLSGISVAIVDAITAVIQISSLSSFILMSIA